MKSCTFHLGQNMANQSNVRNSRTSSMSLDETDTISSAQNRLSPKIDCEARLGPSTCGACVGQIYGFQNTSC
jgi:hypothetical protein